MNLLKSPKLIEKIENRKFLWFTWKKKTWYIEWEFCVLGPYYEYNEAVAMHNMALASYEVR